MFIAGLFSTMNIWANSPKDVRFTWNDFYMVYLMLSWMILITGIWHKNWKFIAIGFLFVSIQLYFIRNQVWITENQYVKGMIPHHSMAVLMSKKVLEKNPSEEVKQLATKIIVNQEEEIQLLKKLEV